jgi:ribonuclease-3
VDRERKTALEALAKKLDLDFKNLELFDGALTHSSYVNEREKGACRDNEALEFLGDAVLGLVVSHHLYNLFPSHPPGHYSALKADLVNQSTLARCARESSLGECIRLGRGEELSNGKERDSVLANALEAVIGAVFLDGGLVSAREFVLRLMTPYLEESGRRKARRDSKSLLQNITQDRFKVLPQYLVVSETGPDHKRRFEIELAINGEVYGKGAGRSKKAAEQNAAKEALRRLEENSDAGSTSGESCDGEEQ